MSRVEFRLVVTALYKSKILLNSLPPFILVLDIGDFHKLYKKITLLYFILIPNRITQFYHTLFANLIFGCFPKPESDSKDMIHNWLGFGGNKTELQRLESFRDGVSTSLGTPEKFRG